MLPKKPSASQWQQELSQAFTSLEEICQVLNLPSLSLDDKKLAQKAAQDFKLLVPRHFVSLMQPNNPNDPLLLQVLPQSAEMQQVAGFTSDPLGEAAANPLAGVIHKYKNRLLLTASGACAVNCRYCFRRHFPYQDNSLSRKEFTKVLDYIKSQPAINEVIFSGGDPLVTSDARLAFFMQELAQLEQLTRVRIHTRLPVVLPSRLTEELSQLLTTSRLKTVLVLHINHPQEISLPLAEGLKKLHQQGVLLLNQSVLLKGVNNQAKLLAELSEALFNINVLPYYLHTLDKVAGAAHFALSIEEAQKIYAELLTLSSGFLVPKLVTEEAGKLSKTPLNPSLINPLVNPC